MNYMNEEVNDMGQWVISVLGHIYFMSDIIMPVHALEDVTTDWCVRC